MKSEDTGKIVDQFLELVALCNSMVKLHKERQCILTVNMEQMEDILGEIKVQLLKEKA